ncbi:TonB-dependent receptor [Sphingomonas sp. HF-S4]|uniref:TonB-dependent receptor n=1 Tax=Sphingomonas agrestis TaxID=3080540 RepID=A0ABU3Y4A3_9SPHN|nr:TonB-dependent receptor [Sphingomonas sp. HF-S4]MDV3456185.1 TonB-dependent receptor [Sphingomonas sp. HF-S4]
MKQYLYASVASIALVSSASAIAQTAPAADPAVGQDPSAAADEGAEDIVVTGIRQSLARAAEIKRESPAVVDSIVAEDIGKLPDLTTASALQRVPGVQVVVGGNNEIVGARIRGLDDIITTLNGREIFTGVGRGFSFQDLPAEALAGVDVYKSSSAERIEGGVAGGVDMRLRRALDFKELTIAGSARATYLKEAGSDDTLNPAVSLLVANRWSTGAGDIAAMLGISYQRNKYARPIAWNDWTRATSAAPAGSPQNLHAPTGFAAGVEFGHYERPQANFSLEWAPDPTSKIYVEGLFAGYRGNVFQARPTFRAYTGSSFTATAGDTCEDFAVGPDGYYSGNVRSPSNPTGTGTIRQLCNATGYTARNLEYYTATVANRARTDIYVLATGFNKEFGALTWNTDISYESSTNRNNSFRVDIGKRIAELTQIRDVNHEVQATTPGNPMNDPAGLAFANGMTEDINRSRGTLWAVMSDMKYDFGGGFLDHLQAGVRIARRKADFEQYLGGPPAPGGSFVTPLSAAGLPSDILVQAPGVPQMNEGASFLQIDPNYLLQEDIKRQLRTLYRISPNTPAFDPTRDYDAQEKSYAGFIQAGYNIALGDTIAIDGMVGLRVTRTDRDIAGSGRVTDPATSTSSVVLVQRSTSDTDLLPNASARIKFGGGLQSRFNYSKTLSRPSFGQLNPGLSYVVSYVNTIQNSGSGGNPDLKPQKADSFDASLEYYFGSSNYVSVVAFYRDIKDRIISGTEARTIDGLQYVISTPRNLGAAKIKGLEVGGQLFLDFLPEGLDGLGVIGNFTIIDSEVTTPGDRLEGLPLLGVSKYNYNAGLIFEKYGISARAIYTYRSQYFDGDITNGLSLRPVSIPVGLNGIRAAGRLDFGLNYDLTPDITISLAGTNVTGQRTRNFESREDFVREVRNDDTTYSLGVRFNF